MYNRMWSPPPPPANLTHRNNAEILSYKPWRPKGCFHCEIIINVLVNSFRLIWLLMAWIYGHYIYFLFFIAGTVVIRQNQTSVDVRFWRIKTVPAHTDCTVYFSSLFLTCCTFFQALVSEGGSRPERLKFDSVSLYTCLDFFISFVPCPRQMLDLSRKDPRGQGHQLACLSLTLLARS